MRTASGISAGGSVSLEPAEDARTKRRHRAAELYQELGSIVKVAAELDCGVATVSRDLDALGIDRTNGPVQLGQAEQRRSVDLYAELHSIPQVADQLGCSSTTVHKYLKEAGVECDFGSLRVHPQPEPRPCARCGEVFTPEGYNVAKGWGNYCSKRCSALSTAAHEKRTGRMVECANCGDKFWRYESEMRETNFCSHVCWGLFRWSKGVAISPELVSLVKGSARQHWLGRWGGSKPPAPGGRPRGRPRVDVTAGQRVAIADLSSQGWGRRAIAGRLLLSEQAVRNVLADA